MYTEKRFASVRSDTSTASSGFVVVSQQTSILSRNLYEPPPDYQTDSDDEDSTPTIRQVTGKSTAREIASPHEMRPLTTCNEVYEDNSKKNIWRKTQSSAGREIARQEEVSPLTATIQETDRSDTKHTIVRINSASHDIHVEVIDKPNAQTSPVSQGSNANESVFLYDDKQGRKPRRTEKKTCGCLKTRKEKYLCAAVVIVLCIAATAGTVVALMATDVIS